MNKTLRFLTMSMAVMLTGSAVADTVRLYKKASTVESGKHYLMVAEAGGAMKVAQPITSNYGYIRVEDATVTPDGLTMPSAANDYVLEADGNGFKFQQSDGRYLYMTGTYNSFNVNAAPTEGTEFAFELQEDGTFKITNQLKNKYIQYSTSHTSYGCYDSAQSGGVLPQLYVYDRDVEGQAAEVQKVGSIVEFIGVGDNEVAELTLTDAQVLYVNDYNNTKEIFVRDATGALDLYNLGIDATAGQVLNGTIVGKRGSRSGFVYAMLKDTKTDASTVTVGAAQQVEAYEMSFDEAAEKYCDYVVLRDVTVSNKKAVNEDGEELALYDRFQLKLIDDLKADGTKYDIYGLMYDGGDNYGAELVVTKTTLAGGGEVVEDPATPVESIEALLAMNNASNIELTLNEAKVLFNDNNYIYVREGLSAVCFYQMNVFKELFKNNAVVSGKVKADYEVYRLLPELKANKHTNAEGLTVVESDEPAEPVATTLADVAAGMNVCNLVRLTANLVREQTFNDDGTVKSTTYYLQDGGTKLVVVNNSKNLKTLADNGVEQIIVTGIVNTASDAYQVKLTVNAEDANASGISTVAGDVRSGAVYNLQGQRVEPTTPGLYIIDGKKRLVK